MSILISDNNSIVVCCGAQANDFFKFSNVGRGFTTSPFIAAW